MKDKPLYWDVERREMYYITWYDTGNSEIPTRHYIETTHNIAFWEARNMDDKTTPPQR